MTFYLRLLILRPKLSKCLENSRILCKYLYIRNMRFIPITKTKKSALKCEGLSKFKIDVQNTKSPQKKK